MPENEDEVLKDKPVQLKGVDTAGSDAFEDRYGKVKDEWRNRDLTPKTSQESFLRDVSFYGESISSSDPGGTPSLPMDLVEASYAPVNLAEGIPDSWERAQFIDKHGEKMVQLATPDTYALNFEQDLFDLNVYNQKQYPKAVKKFIDDLDENQGIASEMFNIVTSLVGKTAVAMSGLIPLFYGIGSAIINGDRTKVFDNTLFDAWEYMDNALSENFVVYGGSDIYDFDPEAKDGNYFKQKGFFGRMWNDPIKSISSDIVPAAAFIGGAVLGEMGYAKLPKIGSGLTKTAATIPALGTAWFSKSVRVARGLDKLDNFAAMKRVASHRKLWEGGFKTIGTAVRTSGYESALIARSTQDRTLNNLVAAHWENHGREPFTWEMRQYRDAADKAGDTAFMLNVPLVAGSTFLQFPKLFGRNWKFHSSGAGILNRFKLGKTRIQDFKRVANVDANKYLKYLGYAGATAGRGITEGWEEFAQGAMEEGLIDYYTYPYRKETLGSQISFLHAMGKAGNNYANSQEGKDSMAIGTLMGMFGMPLPARINSDGTVSGGFQWHGGIPEGIRETRDKIKEARESAIQMNNANEVLTNNFHEFFKQKAIQEDQDDFAMVNDIMNFKNKEFEGLFNYVSSRHANGISDTIIQDLESLEVMPLDQFNKQFASEGLIEYTEESRKEVLTAAKERVNTMLDSIDGIETILNDDPSIIDNFNKHIEGTYNGKINELDQRVYQEAFKNYLAYLDAAGINADERSDKLIEEISKESKGAVNTSIFDKATETIVGIDPDAETLEKSVEFSDQAIGTKDEKTGQNVLLSEIKKEWKKNNLKNYNKNSKKLEQKIEDAIKLKGRSSRAASLFNHLFTKKGFEGLAKFSVELGMISNLVRDEFVKEQLAKTKNNPNSINREELNGDSVFGKENNPVRIQHLKDIKEQLAKVKSFSDGLEGVEASERAEALLKQLDLNPDLFKSIKDTLANREDNPLDLTGIGTVEQLKNLGGNYVNEVLDVLENMLENFKEVSAQMDQFIADGMATPGTSTEEDIPHDVITGKISIENSFRPGSRTSAVGMILHTPDKEINSVKPRSKEERADTPMPVDHRNKTDEGWKDSEGEFRLNNALINDHEFLKNKDLSSGKHKVEFRINEDQDSKYREDVNQVIIDTFYIDPDTKEETFLGRLPGYGFTKDGTPKEELYLLQLREAIVKRDEDLNRATDAETGEVVDTAGEIANTIDELNELREEMASKKGTEIVTVKDILTSNPKEIQRVETLKDDGTIQDRYYTDKDGNKYLGLSQIVNPSDFVDEKGEWTGSVPIGTAVDKVLRDFFAGKAPTYTKEIEERLSKEAFDELLKTAEEFENSWRDDDGLLDHIEFLTEGLFIANKDVKASQEHIDKAITTEELRKESYGIATEMDMVVLNKNTGEKHLIDFKTVRVKIGQNAKDKLNYSWEGQPTKKDGYSKQQNATRQILEANEGIKFDSMHLLAVEVSYEPFGQSTDIAKVIPELVELEKESIKEVFPKEYSKQLELKTTQSQVDVTESQIPKNVSSIEIPDPLSDFMVSFKVGNETREIYVKKDIKGVPYIFLNNQKGKRLKRNEVESFARKYVGDDLVDFMLEWKSLSKEEQSIIHHHTLGVPFRSMQDKDFYTPKTVEEINKEYENEVSSKIKQGVDKYLKPFVKATLEERLEKTKKQVNKAKLEKTKQKNSTLVADIEKAIAKLTQSQTGKIKPESEFVLLMQNEKKEKELLAKLESLQEELPELEFNLEEETDVFKTIEDIQEAESTEIESKIEAVKKTANENFSEGDLERARIIDKEFDTIVEAIIKSKINIFFEDGVHEKC